MSRAFGDVDYRQFGLTAEPEVTEWQAIAGADQMLLLATDGVFERLDQQAACEIARSAASGEPACSLSSSLSGTGEQAGTLQ